MLTNSTMENDHQANFGDTAMAYLLKATVMMKANVQLAAVPNEPANPRTCSGSISDIMDHGMGPQPSENETMYTTTLPMAKPPNPV